MFKLGLSYGATICQEKNISELNYWDNEVLEIPLASSSQSVVEKTLDMGKLFSLHVPSYEFINKMEFVKNFRTKNEVLLYTKEIKKALVSLEGKPEYLVAHFPVRMISEDIHLIERLNKVYLAQISDISQKMNIKLFIENVATNKLYYKPYIYKKVLDFCDGLCFDIGHFHNADAVLFQCDSLDNMDYVHEFFDVFFENIRCVHLYNCTNDVHSNFSIHRHYAYGTHKNTSGFMDETKITKSIMQLPNLQYVIHEIHRSEFNPNKDYDFGVFGYYRNRSM